MQALGSQQEGAALLRSDPDRALAIEMAGAGGNFRAEGADLLIALTGAPMTAEIEGVRLHWSGSHVLPRGATLKIGGALKGSYGAPNTVLMPILSPWSGLKRPGWSMRA